MLAVKCNPNDTYWRLTADFRQKCYRAIAFMINFM